ncbi:MAG: hypothetical protein LKJ47_07410 [Bifidobacteriaceae bacterium]|nr:hypothetical protein [Bifidobacteriaceae bacterium]
MLEINFGLPKDDVDYVASYAAVKGFSLERALLEQLLAKDHGAQLMEELLAMSSLLTQKRHGAGERNPSEDYCSFTFSVTSDIFDALLDSAHHRGMLLNEFINRRILEFHIQNPILCLTELTRLARAHDMSVKDLIDASRKGCVDGEISSTVLHLFERAQQEVVEYEAAKARLAR